VQPGQPDLQMIMQQAQKMQEQLIAAQAELASAEVTGQAGNGLVQVTMTAAGEVLAVRIDPQSIRTTSTPSRTSWSARCRTGRGPPSRCRRRRWARWPAAWAAKRAASACRASRQ
jgi:hypothetical protein